MSAQLGLFDTTAATVCRYGLPKVGQADRPCSDPATHAAWWADHDKGTSGRIECCRWHADYYASAWVSTNLRVDRRDHSAGIEILPSRQGDALP